MRNEIYKNIPADKWNDWKWQLQNNVKNVEELKKLIPNIGKTEEEDISTCLKEFRMAITPY